MASVADINALVDKTMATFGRVDILVNNAGVTRSLGFFDVTEADWDWMYSINARGLFFCMQRVAREMIKQQSGKIVNIASIAGKGFRGTSNIAYAGTKGAVIAMTRIAASQLARYNINVNAICPGATRTHLYETIRRRCWPSAASAPRKLTGEWKHRFRWGGRIRRTRSPTWRAFWLRTNRTISPDNRLTLTAVWFG